MRRLLVCIILGIATFHGAVSWAATPWEDYVKLKENYYLFDNQKADRITCQIVTPSLDPANLQESLKPIEKNIKIFENLSDFKVTYSKKNRLIFTVPHFEVFIVSPETADDLKQLEYTVKNFNQSAEGMIQGLVQTIEGILEEFMLLQKDKISDLEVSINGPETIVKYKEHGASNVDVYCGNKRKSLSSKPGLDIDGEDEFENINGKLFLLKSISHIKQGDNISDLNLTIQHKNIDKNIFPDGFEVQMHITNATINLDAKIMVTFNQCKIEQ